MIVDLWLMLMVVDTVANNVGWCWFWYIPQTALPFVLVGSPLTCHFTRRRNDLHGVLFCICTISLSWLSWWMHCVGIAQPWNSRFWPSDCRPAFGWLKSLLLPTIHMQLQDVYIQWLRLFDRVNFYIMSTSAEIVTFTFKQRLINWKGQQYFIGYWQINIDDKFNPGCVSKFQMFFCYWWIHNTYSHLFVLCLMSLILLVFVYPTRVNLEKAWAGLHLLCGSFVGSTESKCPTHPIYIYYVASSEF